MKNWREYFSGKKVWVTGASSGIGAALVAALGHAGIATLASARRKERLDEIAAAHPTVTVLPCDLGSVQSLSAVVEEAWDLMGGIDVIVHNAGVSQRSVFADTEPDALDRVLTVNLNGPIQMTRQILPRMIEQGRGHIVSVTSYAAFVPTPLRTIYTAAKQGQHGFFDALRAEVAPHNIDISLAVPGMVRTDISLNSIDASGQPRNVLDPNQASGISPEACAQLILRGVARKRLQFVIGSNAKIRLARFLRTLVPGLFWRILERADVK